MDLKVVREDVLVLLGRARRTFRGSNLSQPDLETGPIARQQMRVTTSFIIHDLDLEASRIRTSGRLLVRRGYINRNGVGVAGGLPPSRIWAHSPSGRPSGPEYSIRKRDFPIVIGSCPRFASVIA